MTSPEMTKTTSAFYAQAALSFGVALVAAAVGVWHLPVDAWPRAFLALTALHLVTSTFTLAKCVRDQQEASTVRVRMDEARLERMLAEHDPFKAV